MDGADLGNLGSWDYMLLPVQVNNNDGKPDLDHKNGLSILGSHKSMVVPKNLDNQPKE